MLHATSPPGARTLYRPMLSSQKSSSSTDIITSADLTAHFRDYLRVLNTGGWASLRYYVAPRLAHNSRPFTLANFAKMLKAGSTFRPDMIVADTGKRTLAARMEIEVPNDDGSINVFKEHVFYHFDANWKIDEIWSVFNMPDDRRGLNAVGDGRPSKVIPSRPPRDFRDDDRSAF
ncbi:hypothetical protein Q8F55_007506 [Vanrija albida]|uniref:SnoaL-like domain-containing protein n=1 Tax=Vanrija albida TaxID=181172 RepID=A0ABR3PUQ3_9TREE